MYCVYLVVWVMVTKENKLADIAMNSYQCHTSGSSSYNASVCLFAS